MAKKFLTDEEVATLPNVTIYDNGAGFAILVNGFMVHHSRALGDAWRHIEWMHAVASQKFTVGAKKIPVEEWIDGMTKAGMLD